jgi:hypothetical protein
MLQIPPPPRPIDLIGMTMPRTIVSDRTLALAEGVPSLLPTANMTKPPKIPRSTLSARIDAGLAWKPCLLYRFQYDTPSLLTSFHSHIAFVFPHFISPPSSALVFCTVAPLSVATCIHLENGPRFQQSCLPELRHTNADAYVHLAAHAASNYPTLPCKSAQVPQKRHLPKYQLTRHIINPPP